MKKLQIISLVLFFTVLLLPMAFFNFESDAISEIDNRTLAGNPFTESEDLTEGIEDYINDRIGFRDEMISSYTIFNDRLFGKMVHPSYIYGEDGYVFGAGITTVYTSFNDYHVAFADMVKELQDYCEARDVPFLFVFEPAKPAVYSDKIAEGTNYDREWVDLFLAELDERGVNYLDNTVTLQNARDAGIAVFNQKYDANHWNDNGAFYGTQAMLERMQELNPNIHVNQLSEFTISSEHQDSLLVSNFPIDEDVPSYLLKDVETTEKAEDYSGISLDEQFQGFSYTVNQDRVDEGSPRTLMFQGSYMNTYGRKFMMNALGEYISVHDYQNVLDLPYYFNLFQPELVVFEVAEYTLEDYYFSYEKMVSLDYNPVLFLSGEPLLSTSLEATDLTVQQTNELTTFLWETDEDYDSVWAVSGETVYDMKKTDNGYQVTLKVEDPEETADTLQIYVG